MENIYIKLEAYIEKAEESVKNTMPISGITIHLLKKENYLILKKEDLEKLILDLNK